MYAVILTLFGISSVRLISPFLVVCWFLRTSFNSYIALLPLHSFLLMNLRKRSISTIFTKSRRLSFYFLINNWLFSLISLFLTTFVAHIQIKLWFLWIIFLLLSNEVIIEFDQIGKIMNHHLSVVLNKCAWIVMEP